jgi:hypothetical protein
MTYAELHALVGARLPPTWSYGIEVRTLTWRDDGTSRVESEWGAFWYEPQPGDKRKVHSVRAETAHDAWQRVCEALPQLDATGVSDLVGDGSVKR